MVRVPDRRCDPIEERDMKRSGSILMAVIAMAVPVQPTTEYG